MPQLYLHPAGLRGAAERWDRIGMYFLRKPGIIDKQSWYSHPSRTLETIRKVADTLDFRLRESAQSNGSKHVLSYGPGFGNLNH